MSIRTWVAHADVWHTGAAFVACVPHRCGKPNRSGPIAVDRREVRLPWKGLVVHVHPPWNEKWVLIWSIPLPIGGRRIHPQKQRSEQERDHHGDIVGESSFACMHPAH